MDRRVLPDLERREVEAEGLDLPDEVVDLAPGGAREARLRERVLDLHELVEQLGRAGSSPASSRPDARRAGGRGCGAAARR